MATAGPNNPTTASGTGWTNPTNITGAGAFATQNISNGSASETQPLVGTELGFSIPDGATIDGISVTIARKIATSTGFVVDFGGSGVQLLKAGTPAGSAQTDSTQWTASTADSTFGGASDLWGTTWTPADINNAGFGVQAQANYDNESGATRVLYVQNYRITVTYTPGVTNTVRRILNG